MIVKNYKYSIPAIIFFVIAGFSCLNNFGWDFVQSDNITYASSGLGLFVAYMSHKQIKNPLSLVLVVLKGVLPIVKEEYKDNKAVSKMLNDFDKSIKEYEESKEKEEVIIDEESEEEDEKDDEGLVRCTGTCSCSDDDDNCC